MSPSGKFQCDYYLEKERREEEEWSGGNKALKLLQLPVTGQQETCLVGSQPVG